MMADRTFVARHPQPRPARIPTTAATFALVGGPLAWFIGLCANFWLASWSCFPKDQRGITPIEGIGWSWPAMLAVWAAAMLVALLALLASWRLLRDTKEARERDYYHVIEDGDGRLAFLSLWGLLLSGGALLTLSLTVVAFVVLPRCGG
jgi:hypothetical protein